MYLLVSLINVYGTGLIVTAMTLYAVRVVHLTTERAGLALTIVGLVGLLAAMPMGRLAGGLERIYARHEPVADPAAPVSCDTQVGPLSIAAAQSLVLSVNSARIR